MRVLTAEDVRQAVSMKEAIAAVRAGFIALSEGRANVPLRGVLETEKGVTLTMPAHVQGTAFSTVKAVSIYGDNPKQGLPTIHALVLVISAETGEPLVMMDGRVLTAIRTGAASGVATDLLARDDARVLGVIGTGAQARTQIEAVCAVRNIEEIRLYSRTNPQALADDIRDQYDAKIVVAKSAFAAAHGADVVVAATNSKTPVLHRADLSMGVHINGVGSFTPEMQEIDFNILQAAKIFVDHLESVWEEAGDFIIPRNAGRFGEDNIHAEIGEVAAGKAEGRTNPNGITFFKSVGNGVQDAVMADVILNAIKNHDIGTDVNI